MPLHDRPEDLDIRESNRVFFLWAEHIARRVYSSMDIYAGCFTGWGMPRDWPTGEFRSLAAIVSFSPLAIRPPPQEIYLAQVYRKASRASFAPEHPAL